MGKVRIRSSIDDSLGFRPIGTLAPQSKYILSIIFLIIIIIESSFLYWQFGTIIHNKSAKDISEVSFSILLVTNIIWLLFGIFVLGSIPIVVSGCLYTLGSAMVIGARLYYKDGEDIEERCAQLSTD